jgi:cell wall-associated NlpC family hydrolase
MKRTIQSLFVGALVAAGLFVGGGVTHAATHTAQSGDTLARLFPNSWQAVCAHYGINCDLIYPGQVYSDDNLGGSATVVAGISESRPAPAAPAANSGRYVPYGEVLGGYYVMGGTGAGGGFDCSGLTQYLARRMGHSISRTSYSQQYDGRGIGRNELWPGDLVIMNYSGHVAMFIGNGNIVHALNPSQGILVQNMDYAAQWMPITSFRAIGH